MKKIFLTIILVLCTCFFVGCAQNGNSNDGFNDESKTFTVIFDCNGGSQVEGDTATLKQTVSNSKYIVVPTLERDGYTFIGWDIDIALITKDTVVKAQWSEKLFDVKLVNEYKVSDVITVTYTINGDSVFKIRKGEKISTLNIKNPTIHDKYKDEYVFSYWAYVGKGGEYLRINDAVVSEEISNNGIITLYPVCEEVWKGPF